ncbi:TatD family hydrolase [Candidatus Bathyarchaeota archaeon]|nr:TatD family hydrolase [Candidatus Bathyarchaeota archaeon]
MKLVDTHAHIDQISNLERVLINSKNVGVESIIAMSINGKSMKETLNIGKKYPNFIYPTFGIHPTEWLSENLTETFLWMKENLHNCIAIGEIGLDYWGKFSKKKDLQEKQREIYTFQLKLAEENDLPVSIHSRGAWNDALKIALKTGIKKAVFHWFTGSIDLAKEIINNGYYISCTPALEYSKELRDVILNIPLDRILIETDSPVYIRSLNRASDPSDVLITAKLLQAIKDNPLEEVITITRKNAYDLFGITK